MPIDFKKWQFEFTQRNSHPILMADFWTRAMYHYFPEEIKLPLGGRDYIYTGKNSGYVKKNQKQELLKILKNAVSREPYLHYVYKKTLARVAQFEKVADDISKQLNGQISQKDILNFWLRFDDHFCKLIPWFFIPYYITEENFLVDKIKQRLENYKKEVEEITDFNNALAILVQPRIKMYFQQEQYDFYKLVSYAEKYKNFEKDRKFTELANKYLVKYGWTSTYLVLPLVPLSLKVLIKRVHAALKNKFTRQYLLQRQTAVKNKRVAAKLLKLLARDKGLLKNINWAQKYAWLLTASVERSLIATFKLQNFYRLISLAAGIKYADWIHLTSVEIKQALAGSLKISMQEIAKRKSGYFYIFENGKPSLYTGAKARALTKQLERATAALPTKTDQIVGQPASPGQVTGRVRICRSAAEAAKLGPGEILVAVMTTPDYVPAMKQAAAIVTDEGGLLSHAAIVSRELGKPCIVGTKIATRLLKYGDMVEVDAGSGIVKLLGHTLKR